jgi:hypothetical protein
MAPFGGFEVDMDKAGTCSGKERLKRDVWKNAQYSGPQTPATPDPTQNLSFNLNLTSAQQEARASVPLPYAHEGQLAPALFALSLLTFHRSTYREVCRYEGRYLLRPRFCG